MSQDLSLGWSSENTRMRVWNKIEKQLVVIIKCCRTKARDVLVQISPEERKRKLLESIRERYGLWHTISSPGMDMEKILENFAVTAIINSANMRLDDRDREVTACKAKLTKLLIKKLALGWEDIRSSEMLHSFTSTLYEELRWKTRAKLVNPSDNNDSVSLYEPDTSTSLWIVRFSNTETHNEHVLPRAANQPASSTYTTEWGWPQHTIDQTIPKENSGRRYAA